MKIININTSIITLTKNDDKKFLRTLKSINSQEKIFNIEWLIIDGSTNKNQKFKKEIIKKYFYKKNSKKVFIKHVNSVQKKINGIYPNMNYGKKIARGKFIIFLNSGDTFYNKYSLYYLYQNALDSNPNSSIVFGQANIIAPKNIIWNFPSNRLRNIQKWISLFEPNHQSMLISNNLAAKYEFNNKYNIIADGYWKRKIINNATDIIYIRKPVVKFYLDGVSSIKPSKNFFLEIIKNKNINFIRKIIFGIKYIIPSNLFYFYNLLQKYKSLLIDLIIR